MITVNNQNLFFRKLLLVINMRVKYWYWVKSIQVFNLINRNVLFWIKNYNWKRLLSTNNIKVLGWKIFRLKEITSFGWIKNKTNTNLENLLLMMDKNATIKHPKISLLFNKFLINKYKMLFSQNKKFYLSIKTKKSQFLIIKLKKNKNNFSSQQILAK